jgi:glycosyltransferase involved in cell wall biosynthesis
MDSKKAADGLKQHNIPVDKPFFLHVGKDFWYKNRPGLIRIFSRLARYPEFSGHNLIMAGEVLSREEKSIVNTNVPGRVFPTPLVDGQVLSCLYNLAEALIFPSLHEGFGWPLIEAQACGLPVFTSNRPPMTRSAETGRCIRPMRS